MSHASPEDVSTLLVMGGDERIVPAHSDGSNRYFATPFPRQTVTYASSTANDISPDAFCHLSGFVGREDVGPDLPGDRYQALLDAQRVRLRAAYGLDADTAVAFAASGTDLEFVPLAAFAGRAPAGIHNVLLGADEVGSGCILSAHGQYFAGETALGHATVKGSPVPGLPAVTLTEIPVRNGLGEAATSAQIVSGMEAEIARAKAAGAFPLLHIVHGSKTGLILPHLDGIDALRKRHGDGIGFVVDACQARITSEAVRDYLARGAVVLLTGSKFMGGPPFAGFALLPAGLVAAAAAPLGAGMATLFRRGELPGEWPGRDQLPASANPGLLVRLEAALFELERFQRLPFDEVARVIELFRTAALDLIADLGVTRILSYAPGHQNEAQAHPIEMRTLVTLDLSTADLPVDFDMATAIQKAMMEDKVRLGQPVRCARFAHGALRGSVRGTLRVGLSMPQLTALAALDEAAAQRRLSEDMAAIAAAYQRALATLTPA